MLYINNFDVPLNVLILGVRKLTSHLGYIAGCAVICLGFYTPIIKLIESKSIEYGLPCYPVRACLVTFGILVCLVTMFNLRGGLLFWLGLGLVATGLPRYAIQLNDLSKASLNLVLPGNAIGLVLFGCVALALDTYRRQRMRNNYRTESKAQLWASYWLNEEGGWWRMLVTIACAYFCFEFLGVMIYFGVRDSDFFRYCADNFSSVARDGLGMFVLFIPDFLSFVMCLMAVKFLHRRPIKILFSAGESMAVGLAIRSGMVWAVLWFSGIFLHPDGFESMIIRWSEYSPSLWLKFFSVNLCAWTLFAGVEEVIFRGYIQNRIMAWVRVPWIAIIIASLSFMLFHNDTNPPAKVGIFVFGIAMGAGVWRAGSILPAIACHGVGNTLVSISMLTGTKSTMTWIETGIWTLQLSIWYCWLYWATQKKDFKTAAED